MKWYIYAIIALMIIASVGLTILAVNEESVVEEDENETYPLDTVEKVGKHITGLYGIDCTKKDMLFESNVEYTNVPDENGYLGSTAVSVVDGVNHVMAYMYMTSCRSVTSWYDDEQTIPKGGEMIYELWLDPQNGYIYRQTCNTELFKQECKDVEYKNIDFEGNPLYDTYYALE